MLIQLDFSAVLAAWPLLVRGVVWTIALTIVGTVLGLLLGLIELMTIAFLPELTGYKDAFAFILLIVFAMFFPKDFKKKQAAKQHASRPETVGQCSGKRLSGPPDELADGHGQADRRNTESGFSPSRARFSRKPAFCPSVS